MKTFDWYIFFPVPPSGRALDLTSTKSSESDKCPEPHSKLSFKSLEAVLETKEIFERLTEAAKEMVEAMSAIFSDVGNMNEKKDNITAKLDTINASIEQAASASEEISASTDEQVQALQGVAETAEQLQEMSESADKQVRQFKIKEEHHGEM
ncbi:hypothetical protein [Salibacterium sp. K-3]